MRSPALWAAAWICLLTGVGWAKPVFLKVDVTYVDYSSSQPLQATTLGQVPVRAEFPGKRTTGGFTRGDSIGNTGEVIRFEPAQPGDLTFRFEKDQFMPERRKVDRAGLDRSTAQSPLLLKLSMTTADRKLLFRTEPPGATIWLGQSGNAGSTSSLGRGGVAESHYLDQLGLVNTTWDGIGQAPPVKNFIITVGGPGKQGKEVVPYPGYLLLTTDSPQGDWLNKFGTNSTVVMIPPEDQEPLKLKPAPGLAALAQRQLNEHLARTVSLGVALLVALILIPTVLLPRFRAHRAVEAQRKKRDDLLNSIDITRDPLLGQPFATSHSSWTIVKKLGAGGMAVVYWALPTDTFNEEDAVALKVMNDEVAEDQEYRKRFDREIQISNQLNHPNIVRLIDWGQREDRLFLVMEFIRGSTLRDHIPKGGATVDQTVNILRGLSAGLSHAHKLGVVHRDLKPDNIMINHNEQVKIMDLGLAKRDENRTAITKTGDTFGTPAYMAPEQIAGSGVPDPRTDQYAVGVMVYELLTGRRPFEEEDSLQMIMKHLQEIPPSIREFKPELPEAAAQVVAKMLAKDPSARYANVQAACGALEDALRPLLAH